MAVNEKHEGRLPLNIDLKQLKRVHFTLIPELASELAKRLQPDELLSIAELKSLLLECANSEAETILASDNLRLFVSEFEKAWDLRWKRR